MAAKRGPWLWAGAAGLTALATAGAAGQRRHLRRIASDPERKVLDSPPVGRPLEIVSRDGTTLHAEVFGEQPDDAQTIVLAHGWTETIRYWAYVISELTEKGFRVVAYDLRGHGDSSPATDGDYSLTRFGEDVEAVLEKCVPNDGRAVVVGHSLGAMSIVAWAEHHDAERRIGAAALLNTGVGDLIKDSLLLPVKWIPRAISEAAAIHGFLGARTPLPHISTPAGHAAIRYFAFGPEATPAQVAFYERMLMTCPPDARAGVGIAVARMELHYALPKLTVPTLVMAGASDRLTPPSHAKRIADALPQLTRLIVLPDTGHMGPLERPREISEALAELAESVAARPGAVAA
jgi:pimeloyl-ACP methyl ester carboxylesterase